MRLLQLLTGTALASVATAGFATYKEIRSGFDNCNIIHYEELDRSDTLFLYIQIVHGQDYSDVIKDFKTLAKNYGERGVKAIPRVRYGKADGSVTSEPNDLNAIKEDVATWVGVFSEVKDIITIPVIQAGFLGEWGEWHSGPFVPGKGIYETKANIAAKKAVIELLLPLGIKIAVRYPQDHSVMGYEFNRQVTIHNDCIFNNGPGRDDGGTFPEEDIETWRAYLKRVASNNTYGGEPCDQASGSGYDWTNYADVCGDNGLIAYINEFKVAYLNPANPPELQKLFNDPAWASCIERMGAALDSYA
ncbi:uncharacterized protein RAG0_00141 [Rhynchosporium agropyri]|uniref:DUF4874 domain-containing protein n=1 Tax=Rhynchosporium agropyri TaxID=914238 RepID=A0A1E1JRA2_9HELO|nr:uncharacterized protein RAG0_00141 [Rhynchosporium agropyri]